MIVKTHTIDENNNIVTVFKDTDTNIEETSGGLLEKRYEIQVIKGDLYSLVSQSLQWNSLLTSLIKDLYDVLDDDYKDRLPTDKRQLIEMSFDYFDNIETVADVKLQQEGFDFIKDIFDKEAETAKLFK